MESDSVRKTRLGKDNSVGELRLNVIQANRLDTFGLKMDSNYNLIRILSYLIDHDYEPAFPSIIFSPIPVPVNLYRFFPESYTTGISFFFKYAAAILRIAYQKQS